MKFLSLAVAAALMGLSVSEATTGTTAGTTSTRLTGKYTSNKKLTSNLMQNAQLYDRESGAHRSLEDAAAEITGAHSIVFKSCESLTVEADFSDDGDDDGAINVQQLYQQGAVKSQKSYVLFDVCLTAYCNSGDSSDRTTYIVDMASFINAFVEFIPSKQEAYCEGCTENENYCIYANQQANGNANYAYNGDGDANNNNNNNNRARFLEQTVVEYIDCDRCQSYGCFSGYTNSDYSLEWIQTMTACEADQGDDDANSPYYYNGKQVTMGFMCNEEGTGVEIAAFLDDECTLYTNQIAYGNLMSQTDYAYWYHSRQHIEYMFNTGFSCYDPTVTYINPADEAAGTYGDDLYGDDANNNGGDDGNAPEAAEWCTNVFDGNMEPVSLSDCGANNNNNNNRNLDEGNGDGDDAYYTQVYTLAEEDIEDSYAVCYALTGLGGQGEHLYDKSGSGSMYQYSGAKTSSSSENWEDELDAEYSQSRARKGAGALTFFVLVAFAAMGVGAAMYLKNKKEQNAKTSSDSKADPLVNKEDEKKGQLA